MRQKGFIKVLGIFGAVLFLSSVVHAETWMKDPTSGCEVWSEDDGSAHEVMSWTGACEQGKAIGRGVLVVTDKDGLSYVYNGEMKNGKANGIGSLKFRREKTGEFDLYIGHFEDSKPVGDGIWSSSKGLFFLGEFEGSFDSGTGTLHVPEDNAIIRGRFVDGKLTGTALASYTTESGEYYFGDVENGKRQGVGTLVQANGDSYIGDFQDGVASGVGAYEKTDGSVAVGQFAHGAPNGACSYIAPNGDIYQGILKNGKPEGTVLVTKVDGTQSTENWKNGEKQE